MAAVKKAKFNLEQASKAIANYPESKFIEPFLSEIHEPEKINATERIFPWLTNISLDCILLVFATHFHRICDYCCCFNKLALAS